MVFLLAVNLSPVIVHADIFEFLTYSPPKGWVKESLPDGIAYRRPDGIGLIAIYASYQSTGSAADEFAKVWRARVQNVTQAAAPQPKIERDGDFNLAIGAQRVNTKDGITGVSLVTIVGRGRSLSVLTISMGDTVQNEITSFLDSISILPAASAASSGNAGGVEVDFAVPTGYISERDGRTLIIKPVTVSEKTPCIYAIGPARSSSGNLEADALRSVLEPLPGWQLKGERYDSFRGIADGGWNYFAVRTDVQMLVGGSYQYLSAISMAFPGAAGQVNIVWGFGSLSHCTGEEIPFRRLFHSLRPRGVATDGGKAFAREFAGAWLNSQGVGIARYKFLSNGRYESGQATSTTFGNLETRNSSVTDGTWSLNGSELTIKPDRRDMGVKKYRVLVFDRNTGGKWFRMMFLLDESANPPLDVRYERIEN